MTLMIDIRQSQLCMPKLKLITLNLENNTRTTTLIRDIYIYNFNYQIRCKARDIHTKRLYTSNTALFCLNEHCPTGSCKQKHVKQLEITPETLTTLRHKIEADRQHVSKWVYFAQLQHKQ